MPIEETVEIDSVEDEVAASGDSTLTAGEVLQQERIRHGLSEKDVADKLHITMHYVRALESNSYEKLPGAVFARGYIKSYALLLELNQLDLLQLYDAFHAHQQEQQEQQETANRNLARRQKDRNRPWVILSIAAFIGSFIALWGFYSFFTANPEAPNETPNTTPGNTDTALSSGQDEVSPTPEQPIATLGQSNPERAAEPIVAPNSLLEDAVAEDAEALIRIGEFGADLLELSFSGDSWIEVSDGESNQIYRDIRKAGDRLEIIGDAPFTQLLGDAPFARVRLNGVEIDLSSYMRIDNSARLTLGEDDADPDSA